MRRLQHAHRCLIAALAAAFALPATAADPWAAQDRALFAVNTALVAADWSQTRYIARHPNLYREDSAWFIGPHPTVGQVDAYFVGTLAINFAVVDLLPEKWRTVYQGFFMVHRAQFVLSNHAVGIEMRF